MSVPSFDQLMLPFLQVLAERGKVSLGDVRDAIAARLSLPESALEEMLPSGRQTKFYSRVGWARTYLTKAGLARTISRGVFELSEAGRALVATNPTRITKDDLLRYESFNQWMEESRATISGAGAASDASAVLVEELAPEEAVANGYKQLENALADEIVEALQDVTWQRFEEVVVDVLQALGYGGGRSGAGRVFQVSGDEGVDGVIDEDPLGLSKVYVQAKKYALENSVSRPTIQAFVGSLLGKKSKQGVFITTSRFTAEAAQYAESLSELRVVLIDGRRLARLMINAGVGVVEQDRYVIRRLDRDYFEQ